jgi:uncharacterized membrane protein
MDRAKAVAGAMASMRMEGFVYTDEEIILFDRLAKGEISCDDVRKIADEEVRICKIEHPEYFAKR